MNSDCPDCLTRERRYQQLQIDYEKQGQHLEYWQTRAREAEQVAGKLGHLLRFVKRALLIGNQQVFLEAEIQRVKVHCVPSEDHARDVC